MKGNCLCGGIQYEISGPITEVAMCHCKQCRRAQGTAFATNAPIARDRFTLLKGEHLIKEFMSNPDKARAFCSECGSPLYSRRVSNPDVLRLRVGLFEDESDIQPNYHIYYASKAEWFDAADALPKHDEMPL